MPVKLLPSMKPALLTLLSVTAVLLAGCVVTSVYPYFNEKDRSFEPALLGEWTNSTSADQRWKFEKDGELAYRLTCTESAKVTVMQAQPFQLRGELFLDLSRTNGEDEPFPPGIPSHVLLRVRERSPDLRLAPLKYDWLAKELAEQPTALRHHYIKTGEKPDDRYYVVTADTMELQRFVLKHLPEAAPWADELTLKRVTAK
jgi:hypothetical protein